MIEFLLTLFRLEERARAFFVTTILNVLAAIGLTVVLVVGQGEGARGLLLGSYASGAVFVLGLIFVHRRRLSLWIDRALLRRLMRFGLPTMPAELSLYLLNFVDRIIIVRTRRPRRGRPLLAGGQVRPGGQRPRPRLPARLAAARLLDPRRRRGPPRLRRGRHLVRRRLRLRRHRDVAALALDRRGPWRRPKFFDSYEAIGLIATGVTLYALYMVLVVILGRTGRTEFNFPATIAALVANVALNLLLVPSLGIVGAGLALVASYLVVVGADVRLHPAPLPGPLRMGPPRPGRPRSRPRWSRSASCCCRPRASPACSAACVVWAALPGRPARQRLLQRRGAPLARAACATRAELLGALRAASRAPGRRSTARSPRPTRPSQRSTKTAD